MTAAIAIRLTPSLAGYRGDWRFSELRSAHSATSGRSELDDTLQIQCMSATRS